ncbi:hypothetical protein MHU86_14202 [Fragilaria crotonensis]|nr:hypothetical protein MHU86_14202 [Fragilaria crotonensis]
MKHTLTKGLQKAKSIKHLSSARHVESKQTKALLVEIQTTINKVACYDSPEIVQGGDSMTEMEQAKMMIDNFGGNNDPESISYLDQFVNGLGRFVVLFTSSEPDKSGQIFLTMPQKLQRQKGLHIIVGPTSITKDLLLQRNFTNTTKITGRTLHKRALEEVPTCNKMMALVAASGFHTETEIFHRVQTGMTTTSYGALMRSRWNLNEKKTEENLGECKKLQW